MTPQTFFIDTPQKRDRAVKWLAQIPLEGTIELSVKPYKPTRSQLQNRRYWLILQKIKEVTGHETDELHEIFKQKFLGMQTAEIAGREVTHQRSSARLKTSEFAEYMERVESWAIETLGVWLE